MQDPISDPDGEAQDIAGLERGWLKGLVGYHLRMAHLALYRHFADTMVDLGLTQKQLAAMELIATNPGASQIDVANALAMDRATMMGMVKRLTGRHLIERRASTSDRRRQELRLTAEGQSVLQTAHRLIEDHEERFCAVLTPAERESLIGILRRLYEQEPPV